MNIGLITIGMWIVFTTVGVLASAFNLRNSILDLRYVQSLRLVNGRALVAKTAIFSESLRLTAHLLLLTAGCLVASDQINPNPPPASLVIRSAIILTIVVLLVSTLTAQWLRRRLTHQWRGGE